MLRDVSPRKTKINPKYSLQILKGPIRELNYGYRWAGFLPFLSHTHKRLSFRPAQIANFWENCFQKALDSSFIFLCCLGLRRQPCLLVIWPHFYLLPLQPQSRSATFKSHCPATDPRRLWEIPEVYQGPKKVPFELEPSENLLNGYCLILSALVHWKLNHFSMRIVSCESRHPQPQLWAQDERLSRWTDMDTKSHRGSYCHCNEGKGKNTTDTHLFADSSSRKM